jgi:hypothetical protein
MRMKSIIQPFLPLARAFGAQVKKTADFVITDFYDHFTQPHSIVGLAGCWQMLS